MKRLHFRHSAGLTEGKPVQSYKEKTIFLSIPHNDKIRDCHAWTL